MVKIRKRHSGDCPFGRSRNAFDFVSIAGMLARNERLSVLHIDLAFHAANAHVDRRAFDGGVFIEPTPRAVCVSAYTFTRSECGDPDMRKDYPF